MLAVADAAIEFEGRIVAMVDFEMNGVDSHFVSLPFNKSHGLAAKSAAAMLRNDIQFVDEGVVSAEFEAEADSQDDVADERVALIKEPDAAESGKRQELMKGGTRGRLVERDNFRILLRKSAYHGEQYGFVAGDGFAKLER
jgi:hypothetical protein